jgi:hypothetical protein
MKQITKLGIILLIVLMPVSCVDLDINKDPDNAISTSGSVATRLPAIQFWMGQTYQVSGVFGALMEQQMTLDTRGGRYGSLAEWTAANNTAATYPYQAFFVGVGGTLPHLYLMAEKEGAYHYMGIVKLFRAMGFMAMADVYGEMPYTEALDDAIISPKFDDGKTIFEGCMDELDEAIALFKQTQNPEVPSLSEGDSWNGGDVDKWIRLCYGLKARWLNNLSKKTTYDADAILAALADAPQSNAHSTVIRHKNIDANNVDRLWGDPVNVSYTYIWLNNWSNIYYPTKWYVDLLTDLYGENVIDPRADKLVPCAQTGNGQWFRTNGVDMQSNVRIGSNWVAPGSYYPDQRKWGKGINLNDGSVIENSDSTVMSLLTVGVARSSISRNFKDVESDGTIINSGNFYSRPDAPTHFLCYPEMCFIKAEALFHKGETGPAFDAYKEGIRAHMELMNEKLSEYNDPVNISKQPIALTEIDDYLNSAAVGTSANLTLGKIMTQKFIALSFSLQNWNDMRRMDYSPSIYYGWAEPFERTSGNNDKRFIPDGKQYRRLCQSPTLEQAYNNANVAASHSHALLDDIYSYPVWWDYPNDNYKE